MNTPIAPTLYDQEIDPNTCELLEGHQHEIADLDALADSITTVGQLNPVQLIEYADGRRLIIAGRRRWLACKSLGLMLRADVWQCSAEDINLELYARAIRIAENLERVEPSAMDIASQMRHIRTERGFRNAAELAEFLGMAESRVKRYLSVFKGSGYLLEKASQHGFPLGAVVELHKCEKALGIAASRKLVDRVVSGELAVRDLIRLRTRRAAQPTEAKHPSRSSVTTLREHSEALLAALPTASDPECSEVVGQLLVALREYLPQEAQPDLLA